MPPPRGDVTALFLGPPGSGKSALIAALCNKDVEMVDIPDGRPDPGVPSLRAAGPGLFLGELSCPPAAPGPWAAEANVLVLVLPGPGGNGEPLAPALGEAARAAMARGTPLLAVRNLGPGDSQNEAQARDQTAALLNSTGLGAAPLFVLQTDCGSSDSCEELERLRGALRSQAEALQRHPQEALPSGVHRECCSEQATRRTAGQMFEPVGMCCKAGKGRNHSAWNVLGCHLHVEEQPRVTEFFSVKNRDGGAGNLRDRPAESLL
ncbi:immunity related GTPase Q [Rhinolophus ferrumequinum]|uniref:Immunity related GTPase Q n=1 Tax=Rhinolophus ferrumequinum TaxID=59479 RepID=A0A7J7SII6_RHIFE|nr:immunity related GTPase Q [Rhinolophus ferrumequinum]